MASRTLTQLLAGARQRANVTNNNFVVDSGELIDRVNEGISKEYDLVLSVYEDYFKKPSNVFTLTGGQLGNSVNVLSISGVTSFFKDNTLEKDPGTSNMREVPRLPSNFERDSGAGPRYEILGTPPVLYVYPPELSAGNYRLWYTPDAPVLVNPGDTLDSTLVKWYDFVEIWTAIYIHQKRDKSEQAASLAGDPNNPLPNTLAYVRADILSLAKNRMAQPQQVPMGRKKSSFWAWDDNS